MNIPISSEIFRISSIILITNVISTYIAIIDTIRRFSCIGIIQLVFSREIQRSEQREIFCPTKEVTWGVFVWRFCSPFLSLRAAVRPISLPLRHRNLPVRLCAYAHRPASTHVDPRRSPELLNDMGINCGSPNGSPHRISRALTGAEYWNRRGFAAANNVTRASAQTNANPRRARFFDLPGGGGHH